MGKKVFSLCMALVLCLSLLPATALADAPDGQLIYVGGVKISSSGYWTTDDDGNVTANTGGDTPTDNYIHYGADDNTLTLHNATIKKGLDSNQSIQGGTYIGGSAIGVFNQNGNAELTIQLEGDNTIKDVSTGIFVLANSSSTGDATLTIRGDGNLTASGSLNAGIFVQSNGGNATLSIENAEVTTTSSSSDGVLVQAKGGSNASLTVNGGSLTATGKSELGAGIRYTFGGGGSGSGVPSLNVSNSAIVKASGDTGGITSNSSPVTPSGTGIVFNNGTGTVYGSVTLQEDLTIGEGESLTIPDGASLNTDGKLTVDGGTLTGGDKITGTVKYAPTITTESLPNGTVNEEYSQTLAATGSDTITWGIESGGTLPTGLTLGTSTGVISGTPTVDGTFNFTVKATNGGGSDSRAFTLMVNAAPTGPAITAQPSNVTVAAGGAATFSVSATGSGTLTYQWQQSTGNGANWTDISGANSATYTIENTTTGMSGYQYHCVVTDGNSNSVTSQAATLTVTAPPEPEPEPTPPPYIPPSKPNWTSVARKLANAQPGDTVTVKMNGETEVPGEVWETIAGRDVTVILDMGGNVSWTVDGNDVPTATHFADMDFGVDRNTTGIDVDVINAITGEVSSVQITLAHDGEFGFTLTLTAPLGRENAGRWANLYHYHEDAESLSYETSSEIQEDGTASLKMTHASQYAIIIDEQTHQLPFEDVASGAWYEGAVRYAYLHDIMEGMSATTFQPNGTLSRAMAVQIFYNLEGQPDISDEYLGYPYEDVNAQAWYGNAVYWARLTGVATGYGDGTFQPTDSITRQEFAQMLYNYAKYKGYDLSAEGDLSQFPDSGSVADWAETAMSWANGNELINGHDNGTIDAGGTAIRAQAASILMRFDQTIQTE